jgi:hypothetical protein
VKVYIVRWLPLQKRFAAITWPPLGIFVRCAWWEEASFARRVKLLKHEKVHWDQYQRYGLFGFYWKYLILSLRYGYNNHPMEIEARQANL